MAAIMKMLRRKINMDSNLQKLIDDFLEYLEIEKNCSKLTIRDYRHYLEIFNKWFSTSQPLKTISDLDLQTVRKYRVFLANRVDDKGLTLKRNSHLEFIWSLKHTL